MATLDKNFIVKNGLNVGSTINAIASTSSLAPINIPHGTAPSSPTNGDLWTTTSGIFARINGSTLSLGSAPATNTTLGTVYGNTSASVYQVSLGYGSLGGNTFNGIASTVIIGYNAGFNLNTGEKNVSIGGFTLNATSSATQNTVVGTEAGRWTTGNNNTILGFKADGLNPGTNGSNNIVIGANSSPSTSSISNEITLGDSNITSFRIPGLSITASTTGLTAPSFIRAGGTSAQFLKADGSVDSSVFPKTTYSSIPPVSPTPNAGDYWVNSETGIQYVYINDGNSAQWVSNDSGPTISSTRSEIATIVQNIQTSGYVLQVTDNGKYVDITTGGVAITTATAMTAGQNAMIYNNSATSQTISQGSGVTLRQAGTSNTGNRTLAQYGVATVLCVASNVYVISGTGLS